MFYGSIFWASGLDKNADLRGVPPAPDTVGDFRYWAPVAGNAGDEVESVGMDEYNRADAGDADSTDYPANTVDCIWSGTRGLGVYVDVLRSYQGHRRADCARVHRRDAELRVPQDAAAVTSAADFILFPDKTGDEPVGWPVVHVLRAADLF
ncbi:hypothetical protein A5784_08015 [Mycobacterium sp. 852013-50091_SCH5140682]|nr:hypothetical protein A5784_08015 [Mycobacterium sp. 852013-50091_SCH5140682]